jgi:alpha-ketoglutarate-dependent taurine dioxygenase
MNHFAVKDAALSVRPIGPTVGAEVTGMPIHGHVSPDMLSQFISPLHRCRVLVVPEIALEPVDLVAFSARFGPLEIHSRFDNTLSARREAFCVGNVERDGMKASFSRGVEQWHADSSYRLVPSDASLVLR